MLPTDEFIEAMRSAGLGIKDTIKDDGQIHRFYVQGDKKGSLNGWYVFFAGERPAGAFGSWKTGQQHKWASGCKHLSRAQQQALNEKIQLARKQAEAERRALNESAAKQAQRHWRDAVPANPKHPYLLSKNVKPHGLRQAAGLLLVPLLDVHGKLWNFQCIDFNGKKSFRTGGRVRGLFSPLGDLTHPKKIVICEGWATGATLHEELFLPVLCAMNAGNLKSVAEAARSYWPKTELIIAADDDRNTEGNPGLTKAREAARAVNAHLKVPQFPKGSTGTDFNDLANLTRQGEAS